MIDVFVALPGATAQEVERRVVTPLEKALSEIPNVEYVYSTSQPSGGMIIVRFLVGTDPDQAVTAGARQAGRAGPVAPAGALPPVSRRADRRRPGCAYTLWSEDGHAGAAAPRGGGAEGRAHAPPAGGPGEGAGRAATGGARWTSIASVLAAHHVSILQAYQALAGLNWRLPAGSFAAANAETQVEVGAFFRSADEVGRRGGRSLRREAGLPARRGAVSDGAEEPGQYVWMARGRPRGEGPAGWARCAGGHGGRRQEAGDQRGGAGPRARGADCERYRAR